jgi:hypothetical protein
MSNEIIQAETAVLDDLPSVSVGTTALLLNSDSMDSILRMADLMASGRTTVPKHLQGCPADCMAVIMQAMQWNMNPFVVAQKTHLVNGQLGYEAQLVNAVVQATGAIRGRFHYEYKGEGNALECRVGAVIAGEESITFNEWLKSSDITTKNSPLWKVNPKQQMGYLQVKNWARAYKPGAILGVYTTDELYEITPPAPRNMGSANVVPAEPPKALLEQAGAEAKKGVAAYQEFWKNTGAPNRKLLAAQHEGFKKTAAEVDSNRTLDNTANQAPAKDAAAPAKYSDAMDALLGDLYAAADEGVDAFNSAWESLSPETQDALSGELTQLAARANRVEEAK